MLNSGLAIHAKNTVPEHTKRGVVAQVPFCESSQSVTTESSIPNLIITGCFKTACEYRLFHFIVKMIFISMI